MLEYEFDGQTFNVHPSQKDNFLQKYPEAKLLAGEGNLSPEEFKANVNEQAGLVKTEDPVKETAVAGSQNVSSMAVSYTHLRSPRDRTRSRMPSSA